MNENLQKGWECPLCGSVYAPWISECRHHGPDIKITTYDPLNFSGYPEGTPISATDEFWKYKPLSFCNPGYEDSD